MKLTLAVVLLVASITLNAHAALVTSSQQNSMLPLLRSAESLPTAVFFAGQPSQLDLTKRDASDAAKLAPRMRTGGEAFAKAMYVLGLPDDTALEVVTRIANEKSHLLEQSGLLTRQERYHVRNYDSELKRQRMYDQIKRYLSESDWDAYMQEQQSFRESQDWENKKRSTERAWHKVQLIKVATKAAKKQQRKAEKVAALLAKGQHVHAGPSSSSSAIDTSRARPASANLPHSSEQPELQAPALSPPHKTLRLFGVQIDV